MQAKCKQLRSPKNFLYFNSVKILSLPNDETLIFGRANEAKKLPFPTTIILLIRAPSLIVAPPPEKPLYHDNIMSIC